MGMKFSQGKHPEPLFQADDFCDFLEIAGAPAFLFAFMRRNGGNLC